MAQSDPATAAAKYARAPTIGNIMSQMQGTMTPGKDEVAAQKEVQQREAEQTAALERNRLARKDITDKEIARSEKAEAGIPDVPVVPKTEKEEIPPDHNPMQAMQKFMPMLIMLGGAANKHLGMAALKSAVGAMKGQKSGDLEAQEMAHQKWLDDTKAAMDAYELQSKNYQNVLEKFKYTDESSQRRALAQLQALAADNGDYVTASAIAKGKYEDLFGIRTAQQTALSKMASMLDAEERLKIERAKAAEERQFHRDEINLRRSEIAPATQGFNQAEAAWLAKHPGDTEGALKAGAEAFKQLNPAAMRAMTQQEMSFRSKFENLPQVKAYNTTQTLSGTIDNAENGKMDPHDRATQIAILDAYTKYATGGQAIRGFMLSAGQEHLGLQADAETKLSQLRDPQAKLLPDRVLKSYIKDAKLMRQEIEDAYKKQVVADASRAAAAGLDPNVVWQPQELDMIAEASESPGGYPAPPKEFVDRLVKNPDDLHKQAFDLRFGTGAADAALKGQRK